MTKPLTMMFSSFIEQCRRPEHFSHEVRCLNDHDALSFGGIRCSEKQGRFTYGQAYIRKLHDKQYEFVGLWTLSTKPSRPDIWVQGGFTLFKNGKMKFEREVTALHLHLFIKVCRYLGMHLRVEEARLEQARHEFVKAMDAFDSRWSELRRDEDPELSSKSENCPKAGDFSSWFFAHKLRPLFSGERVVDANTSFNLDIRDRMVTHPYRAFEQKQQMRCQQ